MATFLLTRVQPSYFDNVCNQGGLVQPLWILVFPTEFFCEIIHGYVFGVKESNGDS